jgi:hypothetical protein
MSELHQAVERFVTLSKQRSLNARLPRSILQSSQLAPGIYNAWLLAARQ